MINKFLINILVCTLVFPFGLLAKEKRGTDLEIQTKDEQTFRGELITVKQYSLLLLSEEGADVTVDIRKVRNLTIVKKSKFGSGFWQGAAIGGGISTLIVLGDHWTWDTTTLQIVVTAALFGGLIGGLIGSGAGREACPIDVSALPVHSASQDP